jgi:uncharacterized coiled-coil DUF342 family protein
MIGDIRTRLRRWTHDANAAPASDLMDEAASHIDSLRLEVRTQRQEIAALREERRALIGADAPPERCDTL